MSTEIRVPTLGESVTEATIGQWYKKTGEAVAVDEPLVELETDKVTVEVPAPSAGTLGEILVGDGETVEVGALLGMLEEGTAATAPSTSGASAPKSEPEPTTEDAMPPSPAAKKLMAENNLGAGDVTGSGKRGQILKEDVLAAIASGPPAAAPVATKTKPAPTAETKPAVSGDDADNEVRVRMTRLRQTIAQRLKDAQNSAAMLTTYNDVDMSAVMELRKTYKELFEKKHGVKLGFMGFFVKACVQALQDVPDVNAEIDGDEVVYKNYCHVGVAVGTDRGLVVPVIRNAETKSIAEIEKEIGELGRRARDGKLTIADMQGGTFTISNGGVYGSLMSSPILNAPQSGILGMHRIEQRPVVLNGDIVARPMMYLALSYDHRIVDGKGAVTFLVRVKEAIEDPQRLVLEL